MRTVAVPDGVMSVEQWEKFASRARTCAMFYALNDGQNTAQIRRRLHRKGFPDHEVEVACGDDVVPHDVVEETVAHLTDIGVCDDVESARGQANVLAHQGRSVAYIRAKLRLRMFDLADVDCVLADRDDTDALDVRGRKVLAEPKVRNIADRCSRRVAVVRRMVSCGFTSEDAGDWFDGHDTGADVEAGDIL